MGAFVRALWIGAAFTMGLLVLIILIIPFIPFLIVFGVVTGVAYVVIKEREPDPPDMKRLLEPPD